jgi:hypothetical protein
LFVARAARIVF